MTIEAINVDSEELTQITSEADGDKEKIHSSTKTLKDTATVTTYTINSVTATTIAVSNTSRIAFIASLDAGTADVNLFIRLYPAATDNIQKGIILARRTSSNDALYHPVWQMDGDNIYTGEISAITSAGTFDVHVTEY